MSTTAEGGRTALTKPQLRRLAEASQNHFGQSRRPSNPNALAQAGWRRVMKALAAAGLMAENAFGDYEITDAGRAALSAAKGEGR